MEVLTNYLLQNWALILVLVAFAITLNVTVFLEKKMVIRMYILIISIFLLSIIVFTEFYLSDLGERPDVRIYLMAIRYSATPIIVAMVLYALVKKARWYVLIPSLLLVIINIISIYTGIVFSLDSNGELVRGPLGYLPYIAVGIYCFFLVYVLIRQSNKRATEIIPIAFLLFAFVSGLIFPFFMGKEYSKIFCTTIGIALFVYYVFLILQLTKKDPLTGLLNRQAYYSLTSNNKDITALLSIDMNGLKIINDNEGHAAGDEALKVIGECLTNATRTRELTFRVGGDEFIIVCLKTPLEEVKSLVERIKDNVSKTKYSVSIGYSYFNGEDKHIDELLRESDEMMYQNKAEYYQKINEK